MTSFAVLSRAWPFLAVGAAGAACLVVVVLVRLVRGDHIEPPDEGAAPP